MKAKISVMVVTYNSEKTIEATLNSILCQSYGTENIELIISDDYSQDNTVKFINDWIAINGANFDKVELLINQKNVGISANCNAGWKKCSHTWIKSIGGDDLLEIDCLDKNYQYVTSNPECKIVFSSMQWFGRINKVTPAADKLKFFSLNATEQYNYLMFKSFNIAPTSFINKDVLEKLGFAEEKYTLIEDLPLWLKFTKNGYKLFYFKDITVRYRVQDSTSKHATRYINLPFLAQLIDIDSHFVFRDMPNLYYKLLKIDTLVLLKGKKIISMLTGNNVNTLSKILDVIHLMLRPVCVMRKIYEYFINYIHRVIR